MVDFHATELPYQTYAASAHTSLRPSDMTLTLTSLSVFPVCLPLMSLTACPYDRVPHQGSPQGHSDVCLHAAMCVCHLDLVCVLYVYSNSSQHHPRPTRDRHSLACLPTAHPQLVSCSSRCRAGLRSRALALTPHAHHLPNASCVTGTTRGSLGCVCACVQWVHRVYVRVGVHCHATPLASAHRG